ncbi:hypothetical protein LXL04_010478 [Taraxacum kok-saghyz]
MGKRRGFSKSQNHGDGAPWADLNHHLLSLVMMKLEAFDFLSFSGVCKSWRSLALPNKNMFMASRPPMALWITEKPNKRKEYSLEDLGGKMFKIRLPKSGSRTCVGLTCGYLVLYGRKSCDFLLMNPITRHGIRFPKVLVVVCRHTTGIWFSSIAGKGEWDYVSSNSVIIDVHEFKGKIYAIDTKSRLYEVGLDPMPKLTLLKTKNTVGRKLMFQEFVSSGENLYAMECFYGYEFYNSFDYKVYKLDFGEMKWVSQAENTTKVYVVFVSELKHSAAIKPGLLSESNSWMSYKNRRSSGNIMFLYTGIWSDVEETGETERRRRKRNHGENSSTSTDQLNHAQRLKFVHLRFKSGMAKTRSMARNHNHDDASNRKRIKTWDNGSVAPWSDLNHDLLILVMMKLEAIDFLSFSGVCKFWRSVALPNKSMFMASRPPMMLWISERPNKRKEYSLEDLKEKLFKVRLPKSGSRTCVGLTCGYLVLYGRKSCDFLLMNPITRHGICFPKVPSALFPDPIGERTILVYSPSRSAWVFVVLCKLTRKIWFSIAGKGEWDYVSSNCCLIDLHEFKGKIYAIDYESRLYEVGLDLEPKLMLLNTKNTFGRNLIFPEFVSSGANLYAMESMHKSYCNKKVYKLDFGEMKWVFQVKNPTEDFVFFISDWKYSAAIKPGLWSESDSWLRFKYGRLRGNIRTKENLYLQWLRLATFSTKAPPMDKKISMARKRNHDDASSKERFMPWSDLNHDLLSIVMMQLGVVDFVSFSGVCKSWRTLALYNKKGFMASKPPMMLMRISNHGYKKKCYCYLEYIEGDSFAPGSFDVLCIISIFNNISANAVLGIQDALTSPSICQSINLDLLRGSTTLTASMTDICLSLKRYFLVVWVFIMSDMHTSKLLVCIGGKGEWNQVSTTFPIHDFHAFKGKIYTINPFGHVDEMSFYPNLTLTSLEIKNFGNVFYSYIGFVRSGKNLYVLNYNLQSGFQDRFKIQELDFGKMEWVVPEKTIEKYAFFVSKLNNYDGIKLHPWAEPWSQYEDIALFLTKSPKYKFFVAMIRWYFPHECMNVNLIDDR